MEHTAPVNAPIDALITRLREASWKEREAVKDELLAWCRAHPLDHVAEYLEDARKELPLELRWEIDEVLEALRPEEPPAPEEPEEVLDPTEDEPPADGRLRMSDLKEVYADPRGLVLYTDKTGVRWFASQVDPYTGQPQLFELPPEQVDAVKVQLKGSPYWRIGSGVVP